MVMPCVFESSSRILVVNGILQRPYAIAATAYMGNMEEVASRNNLDLYVPDHNQLFVDIDSVEGWRVFAEWMRTPLVAEDVTVRYTTSKSGWLHCYVTHKRITNFSPYHRIAFETLLGSDSWRGMLAMYDIAEGNEEFASCFFEVPDGCFRDTPEDGQHILLQGSDLYFKTGMETSIIAEEQNPYGMI
jgi:hypothetical protein